jgi:hypothetical protein
MPDTPKKEWLIDWCSNSLFYPDGKEVQCLMRLEDAEELQAQLRKMQDVVDEVDAAMRRSGNAIGVIDRVGTQLLKAKLEALKGNTP